MEKLIKNIMLCLFAVFAFSCNEEMERLLTDDYPESGTEYTTGHVLMVVIDGASGIAVNEAYNTRKAPVIRSMTDKSLFTFYGLADNEEGVSKERGWANLLTGTTKNGLDVNQGIDELETPSFLQRLKEADENLKVSFYSSDTEFFGAFGSVADTKRKTSELDLDPYLYVSASELALAVFTDYISDMESPDTVGPEISPSDDFARATAVLNYNLDELKNILSGNKKRK